MKGFTGKDTMDIKKRLFECRDLDYALFQSKLIPNVSKEKIIGIRIPSLRILAKEYIKDSNCQTFMNDLPHEYFDENMLHGLLISEYKDYEKCINEIDKFLPYVDNWAICDTISPKVFKKHKKELIYKIREWTGSSSVYTNRFGIGMLMRHFLDDDFSIEYLDIPALVRVDDYYVKMMVAWFFATSLSKKWDYAIPYLVNNRLDVWTHNKTIQKSCESFRITDKQKTYLKSLKR